LSSSEEGLSKAEDLLARLEAELQRAKRAAETEAVAGPDAPAA
jgi:hypothetical protein